jgi:hypothetical protein
MSQEPLEATPPIELHEADSPEDFTKDIWADTEDDAVTAADGTP